MRITSGMMAETMLRNLSNARERLEQAQDQITSGRRFTKPEDDPIGAARSLSFRTALDTIDQHLRNIEEASAWLGSTESALASATDLLQRARELTVQASNDSLSPSDRSAVQLELEQIQQQLMQTANATYNGHYVFSGQLTETVPYTLVAGIATYNGDTNAISREIGVNATMDVNIPGNTAFASAFSALNGVISDVAAGNPLSGSLSGLDTALDSVLTARAQAGAKMNRLDDQSNRLNTMKTDTLDLKSKVEDADIAEVVSDYSVQETVYRAALQMGARAVQPTLLDYLR